MAANDISLDVADARAIERCVTDFYAGLDASDGAACAACFTDDGVWERDQGALVGGAAIAQAVSGRPANRRTTHVITNLRVDAQAADRATLRFLLLAFDAAVDDAATAPIGRVAGVRHGCDELARVDGRWRIRRRTSTAWMRGA